VAVVDRVGIMQRLSPYTNLPEGTKLYTHPASAATLQFGNGNLVVVDGSFDDVPAVFISPAIELGNAPDTALSGKDAERRTDMLYGDETVLLFKTAEHASVVAGALIRGNDASNYRPSLGQRKAAQIGQTIGVLAQNKEGRVCAVTDLGLCTLLRQGVTGAGDGGQHIDDIAVDRFAEAMKQKLAKQRQKGYGGWNDKELCPDGRLQKYLGACLGKGDPVDIGNFAMMIWNRGESVTDAGVPDADYIRALQDAFDIIQADANTEENYGSMCRIGSVLGKLKDTPTKTDDWIKCSERLPDVLDVWIKMTDGSVVACWSKLDGDFYWNGGGSESYILENTVTHWKPRQQEPGQ